MYDHKIFHLYRYQVNPNQRIQEMLILEPNQPTVDEIIARKNSYFIEAFNHLTLQGKLENIDGEKDSFRLKKVYPLEEQHEEDVSIFLLGKRKNINIDTPDFRTKQDESWPRCYVIVWNHPDEQIIAIEHRTVVSPSTKTIIKQLETRLNNILEKSNLHSNILPIFNKEDFWELISKERISKIEFHLVTPNMASISSSISDEMKQLQKSINAATATVSLAAEKNNELVLSPDNQQIKDLVDYSSAGGGTIKVSEYGTKKTIDTEKQSVSVNIGTIIIESKNIDLLKQILKEALQQ